MTNICFYGCGQEAKYQFVNGRWCCSDNFHKCPNTREVSRIRALERTKDSAIAILRAKVKNKEMKCKYCGEVGNYILNNNMICCKEKSKLCPEYSNYMSQIHLKRYKEHPEQRENMSKIMKEVQNRPEVASKKRKTMTILHNEACEECEEFQDKYNKGRVKFNKYLYERHEYSLIELGIPESVIPEDPKKRAKLLKEMRYREILKKRETRT